MNTGQKYRYFHYSTLWDFQNVNHKGKPEQPILGMIYKNESCVLKKKKKDNHGVNSEQNSSGIFSSCSLINMEAQARKLTYSKKE